MAFTGDAERAYKCLARMRGAGVPLLQPHWVVDSIAANALQPQHPYRVPDDLCASTFSPPRGDVCAAQVGDHATAVDAGDDQSGATVQRTTTDGQGRISVELKTSTEPRPLTSNIAAVDPRSKSNATSNVATNGVPTATHVGIGAPAAEDGAVRDSTTTVGSAGRGNAPLQSARVVNRAKVMMEVVEDCVGGVHNAAAMIETTTLSPVAHASGEYQRRQSPTTSIVSWGEARTKSLRVDAIESKQMVDRCTPLQEKNTVSAAVARDAKVQQHGDVVENDIGNDTTPLAATTRAQGTRNGNDAAEKMNALVVENTAVDAQNTVLSIVSHKTYGERDLLKVYLG